MTTPTILEDAVEFAENPEPRCPCVLLLDTSGSMRGAPLDALNAGLEAFQQEIGRDTLASRRVEVAVVAKGSPTKYETMTDVELATIIAAGKDISAEARQD